MHSISMLLQKEHASLTDQAVFDLVQYPFSLKMLWAPIVDSLYSILWLFFSYLLKSSYNKNLGRRKSWIVPLQLLTGISTRFPLDNQWSRHSDDSLRRFHLWLHLCENGCPVLGVLLHHHLRLHCHTSMLSLFIKPRLGHCCWWLGSDHVV